MKGRTIAGLVGAALVGSGCMMGFSTIQGSGTQTTETRQVSSFDHINLLGCTDVNVKVGKSVSVKVSGDDNLVPLVKTEVKDGTLVIKFDVHGSVSTKSPLKVDVEVPSLSGFSLSGSGDAKIEGVEADKFDLSISGSGDITAAGKASTLTTSVTGSGDMHLEDLESKKATASVTGSGDIDVSVAEALDATISGSGDISYSGSPKVTKRVIGSGQVRGR